MRKKSGKTPGGRTYYAERSKGKKETVVTNPDTNYARSQYGPPTQWSKTTVKGQTKKLREGPRSTERVDKGPRKKA
jgi:hypothetical protein